MFINLFSIHNSRILQEKVRDQERENNSLYKKVGQLNTQVEQEINEICRIPDNELVGNLLKTKVG